MTATREAPAIGAALDRLIGAIERAGYKVTDRKATTARAQCPAHQGGGQNLSILSTETRVNVRCHSRGCTTEDVLEALGMTWRDRYHERKAEYVYDNGRKVTRWDGKKRNGKGFSQSGTDSTPELYRKSKVKAAVADGVRVLLVEGEEDVHAAEAVGAVATTAPQGATNFAQVDVSILAGADVDAMPDQDEQGDQWAAQVLATVGPIAKSLRFVRAATGKDLCDHLAAEHTLDQLVPIDPPPADDADEGEQSDTTVEDELVARELRQLRVRDRAAKLFARERQGDAEPFDAGTLQDILNRPPEPRARIDGLLPWTASAILVAQRKTGKTTLTANLSRSLILGEDFLGQFGVRKLAGNVGVLNYEVSGPTFARWADDVGVPRNRMFLVNVRGRRNPLSHPDDRARLVALMRSHEVETLIVDPFARAFTGTNQNDAGEVGSWLTDLDLFARAEVGALDVVMPVHAGWNGERSRGSTALEDWADAIWTMTKDDCDDDGARYLRAIGRDVELDEDRLDYDPHTRHLSLSGSGSRSQARTNQKVENLAAYALDAVIANPGMNGEQVASAMKDAGVAMQKGGHAKALALLVKQGKVRFEPGHRGAKCYFPIDLPRHTPTYPSGVPATYPDPPIGRG